MAPRDPIALPHNGGVQDFGTILNLTSAAQPYSHGLKGVDQTMNWTFVNVLVATFFVLMVITLLYRWANMAQAYLRRLFTMGKWADQRYWMYNHNHDWPRIKKHLIYAPLFRVRHNKEIQLSKAVSVGTLPGRYHTILLLVYVVTNFAYCLAIDWHQDTRYSVVAELRGRTGILAGINLVPTVLFALRNNPLIPILGVSYDTFNLLHRWCARVMVFEATAHTICWAANTMSAGGMRQIHVSLQTSTSYRWGMVATCVFGFIFLAALGPIRHAFYETFLNGHRLLVMLGLIGVYVHLDKANLPQLPYVQLCFAFWGGEWAWRVYRILYFNFSRKHGMTKVTVEALPAEACRVTFDLVRTWRWKPGCHVHAYLPEIAGWSSHPFSIAWAENLFQEAASREIEMAERSNSVVASMMMNGGNGKAGNGKRPSLVQRPSNFSKASGTNAMATVAEATHKQQSTNIALTQDSEVNSISLVMRARTGMTRKLYDKANASSTGKITLRGFVEGPYGGHESMSSYGTLILFAGGVGITHCVGYVRHHLLQYQRGLASTQKILLVWSVPNTEALEWVRIWMDKILRMEGRRDVLRIQLYITKPRHQNEVVSNTGSVQMYPGRCKPQTVIEKEMPERIGAVGVGVCGPGPLADSVRKAVRDVQHEGCIDFVEEAFTY